MASNGTTLADGDGQYSDWIEIYNPTTSPIDLGGWHLTDSATNLTKWTFPATTLDAGQYLVVFASNQAAAGYVDGLGYQHTTFALSAGGEYLALVDSTGAIVDEFAPEFPPQSADVSYGRDGAGLNVYFDHPTPGSDNDLSSIITRGVVITEIMYHPSSEQTTEEYIEIYNGESAPVDVSGWTISGGIDLTLPAATIAPGAYLVVAADAAAFAAKYPGVTNVVGGWTGKLSNRSDDLVLTDDVGRLVDTVTYFDQGDWADRELGPLDYSHRGWVWSDAHDGGGSSLELVGLGQSNDYGQNWAASTVADGTPGAANSVRDADDDVAPLLLDIAQTPIIPSSADAVAITARLLDETGAGLAATLYWRVDGASSFNSIAMNDAGAGPDAVAGDLVFAGEIPPQADATIVEFYIAAVDSAGNVRTYPSPTQPSGQQLTNLLYQVDDSFNPAALPGANDPPEYRLIMTEAERAELEQLASNSATRLSHARMNGTLIAITSAGVEARYRVGIRNRGVSSSGRLPHSYHVDIPRDDLWQGLETFNLNTQYTHLQLAGLRLFQQAGAIAEDSQIVEVRVNGADLSDPGSPSYGVYMQMESADHVFASNHFPEDEGGNLYKGTRDDASHAWADFRDLGLDPASYAPFYEKQTNVSEADYSDVLELIQVLNYEPDATYYDRLSQIADIPQWLDYFAIMAILSSEETSIANGVGDDYMLYRGVRDPRFMLIPHDLDTIFGLGDTASSPTSSIYRAAGSAAISRLLYHPQVLPQYHAALRRLLETTFAKDSLDPLLDELLSDFAPISQIDSMKSFMDARRDYILGLVNAPLTVHSQLTTAAGFPHAMQDNVALSGFAPLAGTESVVAGGLPAEFNPVTGVWSLGLSSGGVTDFISSGDVWHYLDAGNVPSTAPGSDWRIDDPGWAKSGPSQLGYGDSQVTVVQYVDTDPVQSGTQKNISTYFRKTFNVTDAANYTALNLRLLRDDGAVVYLNGEEIIRSNIEPGITVTPTTLAQANISGSAEETFLEFAIDPAKLVEGENVIAVEIHQDDDGSSDIGFDLELSGTVGIPGSTGGAPLQPGINRVEVVAYDGPNGTGTPVDTSYIDVWYDDGATTATGGTLSGNVVWTAAAGPYVVTSDLIVEGAATLTIEPGTTVFFNPGTGLTVRNGGRIAAEGTPEQRIRFAHNPVGGGTSWDGMEFLDTDADNRLTYIDMQAGDASGDALVVDTARLLVDHASWLDINAQVLDFVHPTVTVSNSIIPAIGGNETVHLFGLDVGEQFILENNIVGFNSSGDDVMDLGHDTLTPGTIYIRGNTFLGGFDDGIDTDGFPVVIENNSFTNFHLNTSRPTTSNAVSTGHMTVGGQTVSSELTLRNNTFFDNDHHLLLKDLSFATLENNTMVDATLSAIHFEEPGGTSVVGPGRGAAIAGNIFWGTGLTLEGNTPATELTLDQSIVPASLVSLGTGNLAVDPLLVAPAAGDFSVERESLALGNGPNGSDIGAWQAPEWTPASAANLVITELHYHPLAGDKPGGEIGGDADFFEFIELKNTSDETIDLTDVAFDQGIDYRFPWLASLSPGEVVVLAKNLDLFRSRYGEAPTVAGSYLGQLSNGGERVRLRAADGVVIADLTYDDNAPWDSAADGSGASLELTSLTAPPDAASSWQASTIVGGTPGVVAAAADSADFNGDGAVTGFDFLAWQRGNGTPAPLAAPTDGDANGDLAVNAQDLDIWMQQYGAAAPAINAEPKVALSIIAPDDLGTASVDSTLSALPSNVLLSPSAAKTGQSSSPGEGGPGSQHRSWRPTEPPVRGDRSAPSTSVASDDSSELSDDSLVEAVTRNLATPAASPLGSRIGAGMLGAICRFGRS